MTRTLTITRQLPAPPAVVFDAWTDPVTFARWFGGAGVHVPPETVELDARPGGSWRADMVLPDGAVMKWSGVYAELEAPNRLAFTLVDDPDAPAGEPVTVELASDGGGTAMTLVQRADMDDETFELTREGYGAWFDALAATVAARPTA